LSNYENDLFCGPIGYAHGVMAVAQITMLVLENNY